MVLLPQTYVTFADFGYHVYDFGLLAPKDIQIVQLFNF